ncbi:actin-like ATPase domain-containing protein [Annulohypoxylon maeteangense]|uniref:actin-like ATPase domain-containing protein n=1 Tax=Annulohypoxylon maeteangense TaxID=1927788 RepID=UPI002008DE16|nr:actin-like ATPase domain-containing protein [Annulohypoxylon maeteangense]KAI0884507.1 actin-like ATPase domain-containing protein [Annulohypoxylon maeteangense]
MSSSAGASLPHRTVSSIRAGDRSSVQALPSIPHTPPRTIVPSSFGSPSTLRADDEIIVIELGSRKLRIGFAGDPAPKKIVSFGPEQQRRAGDFRAWDVGYQADWRKRASGKPWGADHELWQLDVRGQDLALIGDKLERELRDAFTKYLLIDSRPRRVTLVLPPTLPIPLISSVFDTVFNRFQAPSISLLSSPVMSAMAAGTRSALVIDIGWHETTITAVYEYREVRTWRTVRAGKLLVEETYEFLTNSIRGRPGTARTERPEDKLEDHAVSFEECEEFATRMLWCRRAPGQLAQDTPEGLATLHEQDETETVAPSEDNSPMTVTLNSCKPPKTVEIPFAELAEPCEAVFFEPHLSPCCFDDHEIPVHLLAYRALLQLPLDVRAICMSRIIFTGGCSHIIGLKGRIFDEVSTLAKEHGWDPIRGKGVDQYKTNSKLRRNGSRQSSEGPTPVLQAESSNTEGGETAPPVNPAHAPPEADQVEESVQKDRTNYRPIVQGTLRVLDSIGPWCGASMATQLKIPALATIDRELWLQQGVNGACRPSEVDVKAQQRQSMGAGGLIRGQASQANNNWTLGVWGSII